MKGKIQSRVLLKEVLDKGSEELKPKLEALQSLVNEVTTELYKNASPPPGPEGQQDAGPEGQSTESPSGDESKAN